MTLDQFYHIVRAAAVIANVDYVAVFGSNAILIWLKDLGIHDMKAFLGDELSYELDLSVGGEDRLDLNDLVDSAIGEGSQFHQTYEIYAHPNRMEGLFAAPAEWPKRLRMDREPITGARIVVPHYLDLAVSKIVAGRPKDFTFAARVVQTFGVDPHELAGLIGAYSEEHPESREKVRIHWSIFSHRYLDDSGAPSP